MCIIQNCHFKFVEKYIFVKSNSLPEKEQALKFLAILKLSYAHT